MASFAPMQILAPILQLEPLAADLFRGRTPDDGAFRIFGGQVLAQSLLSAYGTVTDDRLCHSLHAYFLQPGDPKVPVVYAVERARDGGSFATRRVTATQDGKQIFHASLSFQTDHDGLEHQLPAPAAPPPEGLGDDTEREVAAMSDPQAKALMRNRLQRRALEMRSVNPDPARPEAQQQLWIRATEPIGPDPRRQQAVLAYASDLQLMATSLRAHGMSFGSPGVQPVSLDHAIWFHRPTDFSAWHFYDMISAATAGGRGLNRGALYTADGALIASIIQEGLIRVRQAQPAD